MYYFWGKQSPLIVTEILCDCGLYVKFGARILKTGAVTRPYSFEWPSIMLLFLFITFPRLNLLKERKQLCPKLFQNTHV